MIETQTNAHILMNELSSPSSTASSIPEGCKGDDMIMNMNRGNIDTAAPFESVKAAISKFKGLIKWEDEAASPTEKQKNLQHELEKLQEELLQQRKESEAAEGTKGHAVAELESTMMRIEDLKLSLEVAEFQEAEAQQEFVLAQQHLRATELETAPSAVTCASSWSKLQAAKERVDAELSSAKRELESMEEALAVVVGERNDVLSKAKAFVSESVAMERAMEKLRLEIGSTKESAELARFAYIEAEGKKDAAAADFELEKSSWEMEIKRAENKLAELDAALLAKNDLKLKVESSCASLRDVRSELSLFVEARGARTKEVELELEKERLQVEEANDEVDSLKDTISLLKSTLETEKSAMDATRKKEGSASASVPALEADIESTKAEIDLVQRKEKETKEKAEDLSKALDQAKEEANQAKSVVMKSASEELKKAEEEAELAKAEACTMEKRLDAEIKEIEAAKASATMANSTATAMKESKHAKRASKNGMTLPIEEYLELRRKAHEAEEIAKNRVIAAIEQIKEAKESESRMQQELEEVKRALQERKRALRAAVEETERAKAERAMAEQELREWKAMQGQKRKAINVVRSLSGPAELEEAAAVADESPRINVGCTITRSNTISTVGYAPKQTKKKSKSLFPLFSMIWGKKKNQPLC